MIGISIPRELAPLITAIIVAGRSGSSYTAQIGVMKITEEIDAMKIMGFDIYSFLVIPRIAAMIIALPLLIFLQILSEFTVVYLLPNISSILHQHNF